MRLGTLAVLLSIGLCNEAEHGSCAFKLGIGLCNEAGQSLILGIICLLALPTWHGYVVILVIWLSSEAWHRIVFSRVWPVAVC